MRDLGCHPDLFQLAVVKNITNKTKTKKIKKSGKKKGGIKCKREKMKKKTGESLLHAVAKSTKTTETNKQKYQTCWLPEQSAQWMTRWTVTGMSDQ